MHSTPNPVNSKPGTLSGTRPSADFSITSVCPISHLIIQNKNNLVVTIVPALAYNAGQNRQMPEHT